MEKLLTIALNNLKFRAHHGLFPEEKKIGNEFTVHLLVSYIPNSEIITDINDTPDYGKLHQLISDEMKKPRALLETFVMEVAELIHNAFPIVKEIEISIEKMAVPIARFEGSSSVKYRNVYH